MMKKSSKETGKKVYEKLQKSRKKIKRRSIFLAIFVFGVNAFAWFVFISTVDVNIKANVTSWDVNFSDNNVEIGNLEVLTPDLYPGMPTFTKTLKVSNSSDLNAKFEYKVLDIEVLGTSVFNSNNTTEQNVEFLKNTYPFITTISVENTYLPTSESTEFLIKIDWPYEKTDPLAKEYYKLTNQYIYDPSVVYYQLNGNSYTPATVDAETFLTNIENLYAEKDDADSFWGSNCHKYTEEHNDACFKVNLELKVSQAN